MTRELWFRILQVAVVAPWLYHISNKRDTDKYFQVGLKLVAGSVVAINVAPLMEAYQQAASTTALPNVPPVIAQAARARV